jgi:hypothetical protein
VEQSSEEHPAVDDLRNRLAEAADQAAELARGPGPAAALRRASARRRRRAGEALLALAMVAAVVATGRGALVLRPELPAQARRDLAWRPLVASEWRASVPDERPLDPVLVAAQGERAGEPWRLVVYRSTYRPAGGHPVTDVCYLLEWFAMDLGSRPRWQLHGTCAPASQASAVLAVNGPGSGRGLVALIGRAPDSAAWVRLELRGQAPVESATVRLEGASLGRFYVAFVPRTSYLERMVALDDRGHRVGEAAGQGYLSRELVGGDPPTGPIMAVATAPTASHGTVEIVAWPARDGYCLSEQAAGGAGSSSCESTPQALAPRLTCSSSPAGELRLLYGGVPRASRRVVVQAASRRVEVPARDVGAPFDRAFFAAEVSNEPPREPLVVTAYDGRGKRVWQKRLPWRCG